MLFVAFCFALLAPIASAQTAPVKDCDQQFMDFTATHVLQADGAMSKVNAAMQELTSQGVDVRVRMFDNPPGGSVDAYEKAQVETCASWGLKGDIKPNLVVVLVTMEHHDAIFYGEHFGDKMKSEVDSIREAMRDPYEKGQYADAFVIGLHDSSEVIRGNDNPADPGWPTWAIILAIVVGLAILIGIVTVVSGGGGGGSGFVGGGYYGGSSCGGASCGSGGSSGGC